MVILGKVAERFRKSDSLIAENGNLIQNDGRDWNSRKVGMSDGQKIFLP